MTDQWKYPGCMLVVLSVLIRFYLVSSNNWIKYSLATSHIITWNIAQGIVFLLFPLSGVIADLYSLHYKAIRTAFILSMISSVLMVTLVCTRIFFEMIISIDVFVVFAIVFLVLGLISLGLYEATALQYGLRQLFEAPTEYLSMFIHWYFWGLHLSQLLVFYINGILVLCFKNCRFKINGYFETLYILAIAIFVSSFLQVLSTIAGLVVIVKSKSHLEIDLLRFNPFNTIVKILKYTLKHKQPERRSAFTYWENSLPSRIDFGKEKYGGPFTNEEVENTKTFFWLLLLPLSLFGFFIQDSGYSIPMIMYHKLGCPSLTTMFLLNPSHLILVSILTIIPLYRMLINSRFNRYIPTMLTRIWLGMFLSLVRCLLNSLFTIVIPSTNSALIISALNKTAFVMNDQESVGAMCLLNNVKLPDQNGECASLDPGLSSDSYLFYLLMVPQFFHGLSFVLVFMTVLEFICAQAPHTMKGLLIGIWYAMFSLQYLVTDNIALCAIEADDVDQWSIYNGARGLGAFLSVVLFSIFRKFYRYRERNEVINEQAIIEEQYERELLLGSYSCESDNRSLVVEEVSYQQ